MEAWLRAAFSLAPHRLCTIRGTQSLSSARRFLTRQDGHFLRGQRLPFGCSHRHALDETKPFWFGTVGSETEQVVLAQAAPLAARTVLYPKEGARQIGQPAREELVYHLRGQVPRRLSSVIGAADLRRRAADDHRRVAGLTLVDANPVAPGPEPVTRAVVHVLAREIHRLQRSLGEKLPVLPAARRHPLRRTADDPVYEPILNSLLGPKDVVAVGIALDLLERLPRMV